MQKVLLVEPNYRTKYPPLGLMKISTFHKKAGDYVYYVKGINDKLCFTEFDLVYITSLYTFEAIITINTINYYKSKCQNADIQIGGVYASLMPEHVFQETGIYPKVGLWMDVENLPPDYSLVPNHPYSDHSFVFTTRGCPNKCAFCAVKSLEPDLFINHDWKSHISLKLPRIMIHDNNITAAEYTHFQDVMEFLSLVKKPVTFDNGFDCRLFSNKHCDLLTKINISSVRFAFDSMKQDGYIQKSIELCIKKGIPASKILVYVIFNFNDDVNSALHRAKEIAKLGARPYAMKYTPLDRTDLSEYYYGKWNEDLCKDFSFFINICRFANAMPFEEWQAKWKKRRFKEYEKYKC